MMNFIWDENKAKINIIKHGVSFDEAKTTFSDPAAIRIFDPDHSDDEERFILLGQSSKLRLLVVCHSYKEDDRQIRLISVRKASKKEKSTYFRRKHAR